VKRREIIAGLGSAAGFWMLHANAQAAARPKRIAVFMNVPADNPVGQSRLAALLQGLERWGWSVGPKVRMEYRWGANEKQREAYAAELVAMAPDVIVAGAASVLEPLRRLTQTIPIVFFQVNDPVGAGFVASLAHPGGNATGFSLFEFAISSKWVELLKEIAPSVKRIAVLRDRALPAAVAQFAAMQTVAGSQGVELVPFGRLDQEDVQKDVAQFAGRPNGGLIVTVGSAATAQSRSITALAARYKLPAVYPFRFHVSNGGLASYGPDAIDVFRKGAEYVHRILQGDRPEDLPVQQPTKYELAINLRSAKSLGLVIPSTVLARADEVIE
jgi:putative ABC transport system substrate-binding protein